MTQTQITTAHPVPETGMSTNDTPSLAERVSAAQTRLAESTAPAREKAGEKASAAATSTKDFITEHPIWAVTGAVAFGALIALSLPGKRGQKVRGSVLGAGTMIAELAAQYGSQLLEMAEDAANISQDKLQELGDSLAEATHALTDSASNAGESALNSLSRAGERAADSVSRAADSTGRRADTFASRIRR